MRSLLVKLLSICMLSIPVPMTGQFVHKDMKKIKNLRGAVKFGTAVRDVAKHCEEIGNGERRKFLAKVDTGELIHEPFGKYYLTSLKQKLVQEVRDALRVLDISDSFIEKIPTLGMKYIDEKKGNVTAAVARKINFFPISASGKNQSSTTAGILINTEVIPQSSPFMRKFHFLHEGGHVRAYCSGAGNNKELQEVIADTYVLAALTRLTEKKNFQNLVQKCCLFARPNLYLTSYELVYHGKKLFDIQQRGAKLDVPAYARQIVIDRKKDGYKQRITQEVKKTLGSTRDNASNFDSKNLLKKSIKNK